MLLCGKEAVTVPSVWITWVRWVGTFLTLAVNDFWCLVSFMRTWWSVVSSDFNFQKSLVEVIKDMSSLVLFLLDWRISHCRSLNILTHCHWTRWLPTSMLGPPSHSCYLLECVNAIQIPGRPNSKTSRRGLRNVLLAVCLILSFEFTLHNSYGKQWPCDWKSLSKNVVSTEFKFLTETTSIFKHRTYKSRAVKSLLTFLFPQ